MDCDFSGSSDSPELKATPNGHIQRFFRYGDSTHFSVVAFPRKGFTELDKW